MLRSGSVIHPPLLANLNFRHAPATQVCGKRVSKSTRRCRRMVVACTSQAVDQSSSSAIKDEVIFQSEDQVELVYARLEEMVRTAKLASHEFEKYSQEEVDRIFSVIAHEANKHRVPLAQSAALETGMGLFEDKVIKNGVACELIYDRYKDMKTCGIIERNEIQGIVKIATPVGLVCCITPVTNPTSTAIAKSLFCAKTRNAAIFLPHPRAADCTRQAVEICHQAGVKAGAPVGFLQCVDEVSRDISDYVMKHDDINLILATGGPGMVKASYSAGHPAIGVGSGNAPVLIDETANLEEAVGSVVLGKTFDNGMICAAEQSLVVIDPVYDKVKQLLVRRGVHFVTGEDREKLSKFMMIDGRLNASIVGQSAQRLADMIGIQVPPNTVVLAAEASEVGPQEPLSHEKLSPIIALYRAPDYKTGVQLARKLAEYDGIGHTAGIYTKDESRMEDFAMKMPVGRALTNMPTSLSAIGTAFNFNMDPSFTLGVGTQAGSSISTNVGPENLLNIKTLAKRQQHTEWFKNPPQIYFNRNCLEDALRDTSKHYADGSRDKKAIIITDKVMGKLGYVDRVTRTLKEQGFTCQIFNDVNPDPDIATVRRGVQACEAFKPDLMICLGGGSPMDAGKFIRVCYEHPQVSLEDAAARFIELRKRTCSFPQLGSKIHKLVCIPTTSGTASEITPFSVITDDDGQKYPLFSYRLTPDIAIIDSSFCLNLPKSLIANAGVDAITHATEAFVSVAHNDFTETHSLKALKLLFDNLPASYEDGNIEAREAVHHGATLAGLAFSNSFLGINHSLSHKIGAAFHLPHGLTNAILMKHVIKYNAVENPTRMGIYPSYDHPVAGERYAQIARHIGLKGETKEQLIDAYCDKIIETMQRLNMPTSFQDAGIDERTYMHKLDELAIAAFDDQCTVANPRFPLVEELKEILIDSYYGN
eukprot:TRINITY_DN8946_c0_g1_i8.p1 TRINITY_DN8946_c0_g1~~TRINITY_DN8946_c0_g1_i8.p1  ORF type:complete len:932 (-),score=99.40 TRINITY_DN8946_c0_g1_i8:972-3767(-)